MPETKEELREALRKTRRETLAALEEWDYERAAGLIRAAELMEEKLQPGHRSTVEEIRKEGKARWSAHIEK